MTTEALEQPTKEEREEALVDLKEDAKAAPAEAMETDASTNAEAPSSPKSEKQESGEQEAEKSKGVWIIRIPRVDVDNTKLRTLEAELDGLNKQVIALNAIIRVKRVEKEGAFQGTNAAREKLKASSAASREKIGELAPYREKLKVQQEQVRAMKDIGRDLQCKTEEELLRKIEGMEHKIAHDSMTLNEEKEMVKKIKKLKMQKDSIKLYDTNKETLAVTKQEIDEFRDYLKVLNSELDILKFRENGHREVFLKHKESEDAIQQSLGEVIKERNELKVASDKCYERVKKERAKTRKLISEVQRSRQTKNDLKKLIEESKHEEAVALATKSVENWFKDKWNADKAYRERYVANMAKHRHKKTSIEEIRSELDAPVDPKSAAKSKKAPRKPIERAEDVVAALLQQANEEWIESKKAKPPAAPPAAAEPAVVEVEKPDTSSAATKEKAEPREAKREAKKEAKREVKREVKAVVENGEEQPQQQQQQAQAQGGKKPKSARVGPKPLEIDESLVAGFELPSVVREIISENSQRTAREPVKVYSHHQDSSAARASKEKRRTKKAKKAAKRMEMIKQEEEKKHQQQQQREAQEEEDKRKQREAEEEEAKLANGMDDDATTPSKSAQAEAGETVLQSPKGNGSKKSLRRGKKNGKIVLVPTDHRPTWQVLSEAEIESEPVPEDTLALYSVINTIYQMYPDIMFPLGYGNGKDFSILPLPLNSFQYISI